ncbi:hypothetical protein [Pelagicoccus mobilis]|uniref:Lipoprotein n=1 Tax=Pelagicoccus mobilis TaxID=415221 RepID=A0A934RWA4_9BACT|nr:hypothetical protein [Pelagicoccus mobilis]MBK1878920.1 hypothetical protein [Pelagicoccus mobilis]
MKRLCVFSHLLVLLFVSACSPKPDYQVAGAHWLESKQGGGMYDVLAYPLVEDELTYLEGSFAALESAAAANPEVWEEIAVADDLIWAANQGSFWDGADLLGPDVIAVSLKLTFLWEFASAEESMEDDIRENLKFVEQRAQQEGATAELLATADTMRALLNVIEAHKEAAAFEYYAENKERIDAALDRFTSIGEQ